MSKELKISIVDPVGTKAGMDHYDYELARGLRNAGVPCRVISNFERPAEENLETINCFDNTWGLKSVKGIFKYISTWRRALRSAKKFSDRAVFHLFTFSLHNYLVLRFARMFYGIKPFLIVHDVEDWKNEGSAKWKERILNKLADQLLVHNDFSKRELCKDFVPEKPLHVIQQGGYPDLVDQNMTKDQAKEKLGLDTSNEYLLFFGQIKKPKGLDLLLEAFGKVQDRKNLKLIVAGRMWDSTFEEYQSIIDKYEMQDDVLTMIRFITDEERDLLYAACDAMVLPYRKIYQSAVILMALSYSKICIVSDLEPNLLAVKDRENGLVFEQGNSDDLKTKIELFNSLSPNDRLLMEGKAMNILNTYFNWDKIGMQYKTVLSDI